MLTTAQLAAIAPRADAATWLAPLDAAMAERSIGTPARAAAFLAQVAEESVELTRLEERLNYSAARLQAVWPSRFPTLDDAAPYAGQPEALANHVYAGRMGNGDEASGDGWRFRGRGLLQLTGRQLYGQCGAALGVDLLVTPELLLQPPIAARSAAWYWQHKGLNELADGDSDQAFTEITRRINGGTTGLAERRAYWARARQALSVT